MQIKQNGLWVNPPDNLQWKMNNEWHQPSGYKLATDNDFSGTADGQFEYIGTEEYIEIPHVIKGVAVTKYNRMFRDNNTIKGVKSTNANITSASFMFASVGAQAGSLGLPELDLSELNLLSITNTAFMFEYAQIEILDLSNLNTSNITNDFYMFRNATIGTIYARTQADADFFRSIGLSTSTNIIVKN